MTRYTLGSGRFIQPASGLLPYFAFTEPKTTQGMWPHTNHTLKIHSFTTFSFPKVSFQSAGDAQILRVTHIHTTRKVQHANDSPALAPRTWPSLGMMILRHEALRRSLDSGCVDSFGSERFGWLGCGCCCTIPDRCRACGGRHGCCGSLSSTGRFFCGCAGLRNKCGGSTGAVRVRAPGYKCGGCGILCHRCDKRHIFSIQYI